MRDLLEKDPTREVIDTSTIVLDDLVDMLMMEARDGNGKKVMMPSVVVWLKDIRLHTRNFMNTDESRHATHAIKSLKSLRATLKQWEKRCELLERAVKDERLKSNQIYRDNISEQRQ